MSKFSKWFKDTMTEPDGETICPVRILALVGFLYALFVHGWSIFVLHAVFDLTSFGIAYGTMIATLGAALGLKTDSKGKPNDMAN